MLKKTDEEIIELFYKMETRKDLANILEIKDKSLRYYLYVKRPENQYTTFKIKKYDGNFRQIMSPHCELKSVQRKLAYILALIYEPKVCAFGFIKGKNCVDGAHKHINKKIILNIDLKNFFNQIHFGRIRGMLQSKPYELTREVSTTISQIACCDGLLPQGAPTSPIITNMICKPLDNALMKLAKKYKLTYTRYADDITFSSNLLDFPKSIASIENNKVHLGGEILNILKKQGFEINENKVHLRSKKTRQEVTGLVVNRYVNLKREYVKNLRAALFQCHSLGVYQAAVNYIELGQCKNSYILENYKNKNKTELIESWYKKVLKGKLSYMKQIKGIYNGTFICMASTFNSICESEIFDLTYLDNFNKLVENSTVILLYDGNDDYVQGSGFYLKGYGLVTCFHVTEKGYNFDLYSYTNYERNKFAIGKELNEIASSKDIDYALYKVPQEYFEGFKLGNSNLAVGQKVTIVGYPNYDKGDSPYIQNTEITSKKEYLGAEFFTVGGRISHGASGGVVLNEDKCVIGIIKGGVCSFNDDDNEYQGFVPIQLVLEDIANKQ